MSLLSFLFLLFGFLRHQRDGRRKRCGALKSEPNYPVGVAESDEEHSPSISIQSLLVETFTDDSQLSRLRLRSLLHLLSLQRAIGHQSWLDLRTKDRQKARLRFLILLQGDLRCYYCEKLNTFSIEPSSRAP